MSSRPSPDNRFLHLPPGRVFVLNALPMMLIMLMNGLLNIIDAAFLGHFVGTDAMTAIGLVFPAVMVLIALTNLVSGGMSSLLARQLGAGDTDGAGATVARAHGLALSIAAFVMIAFLGGGRVVADQLSASDPAIAGMHTPIWRSPCLRCPFSLPSVCMRTSGGTKAGPGSSPCCPSA